MVTATMQFSTDMFSYNKDTRRFNQEASSLELPAGQWPLRLIECMKQTGDWESEKKTIIQDSEWLSKGVEAG